MFLDPLAKREAGWVYEGFSDSATAVIAAAHVAARQSGAALTGSEHLLLAILTTGSQPERSAFTELGLTALDIEQRITYEVDDSPLANSKWARRWTAECVFMFASCLEIASSSAYQANDTADQPAPGTL